MGPASPEMLARPSRPQLAVRYGYMNEPYSVLVLRNVLASPTLSRNAEILAQRLFLDRLDHVNVEPRVHGAAAILGLTITRHCHQERRLVAPVLTDTTRDLISVESRKTNVDKGHLERAAPKLIQRPKPIRRAVDTMAPHDEKLTQHLARVHVVLDDQDPKRLRNVLGQRVDAHGHRRRT